MMADVFQPVSILAIVESLVFNLPPALRHVVESLAAHLRLCPVGQPVGFNHRTIRLMLPIADHADRFPAERIPWIKIIGIPNLHPVMTVPEFAIRRLEEKRR